MSLREALCDTLELAGYPVVSAEDGRNAMSVIDEQDICMVVSDVQMKPMDGHRLLKSIKSKHPELPVVLMTAYGTIQKAVEAIHNGATDYLVKPFEADVLVEMVSRLLSLPEHTDDPDLIAVDECSRALVSLASRVAESDATVLITGDSGAGKEVYANFIHRHSARKDEQFIAINCAAIPENMLEAMLFGYEKGAFTGAYHASPGKFEQANGGTLLLDEISEMGLALQAKLLRVLQEREVERLGGREVIPLDVRVIATSNRSLKEEVADGNFREDLFYRLSVFPLHLAALRERPDDILPLAESLIIKRNRQARVPELSDEARNLLQSYHWPGNVRELDNVIQRALILQEGDNIDAEAIRFEHVASGNNLPPELRESGSGQQTEELDTSLKSREQRLILKALQDVNGSRKDAAERLGISPRTLRYKLARMRDAGIQLPA
jgi:two-component system response regulator FlrC